MYFVLRPKVHVAVDYLPNRFDPFDTEFLIVNGSEFAITHIKYSYDANIRLAGNVVIKGNQITNVSSGSPNFQPNDSISIIPSNKSSAINKSGYSFKLNAGQIEYGELKMKYSYNYLGIRFTDSTGFRVYRDSDSWYHWLQFLR